MARSLKLYWWSEVRQQRKPAENYGDLIGKFLTERISGRPVRWVSPRRPRFRWRRRRVLYATVGSILEHLHKGFIVWGSGIISRDAIVAPARFTAVRGPLSRKRLLELGYDVPQVYGDPALLLPRHIWGDVEPLFELGIVPHINDLEMVKAWFAGDPTIFIVDLNTNDVEETTRQLRSCKRVLSSSLHGIIVAHAYGIPAVRAVFSDKIYGDGIKYADYNMSVGLPEHDPIVLKNPLPGVMLLEMLENHPHKLPSAKTIYDLCDGLMRVCPFNVGH